MQRTIGSVKMVLARFLDDGLVISFFCGCHELFLGSLEVSSDLNVDNIQINLTR
jgi:hypothetical protein